MNRNELIIPKETLIELYTHQKLSCYKIAKLLTCSRSKVNAYLKKFNILIRKDICSRNIRFHKNPKSVKESEIIFDGRKLKFKNDFKIDN